ncbi:zinc-dependent metalloprotease [Pedobacter hiemivivus]|uniref:DUF5117 domain-containing protein n=1 Tax=Pedobacter hiemivivus TaxID=2530454 RepID=A0A4R0NG21_9SPHI|nr:zinc-dependent metalloprotease [Pedobacter hiemivivus]TCC99461.1 DUF5117 domain-containing protein [Pedobacter hiemivivus]
MKTSKKIIIIYLAILISAISLHSIAQVKDTAKVIVKGKGAPSAITPTKPLPRTDGLKSYEEIIPASANTSSGFFKVHKVDEKYFLEIPDSLLGRELLTVNRISRSAADFRKPESRSVSYAGDMIGENVFNFVKGPSNKMFASITSYKERTSDTSANSLYKAIQKSTMQPIISSFPIKTINSKNNSSVIEITDYISGDNPLFGFDAAQKTLSGLQNPIADRSYLKSVKAYPMNIEIKMVKTYQKSDGALAPVLVYTFEMNSSIVLLPKTPMKARQYDNRVGYFFDEYTDFDLNPRGVKTVGNILRWRMEPNAGDLEKYKRGELVEPAKPIVIYIDPATPKKWVNYLIQGINDWQIAFEKAGFKNAIIGREAPVNDSTWNIDDARHNVLVYKPADVMASSGDIIRDPRSGEILEAHISWYHNATDQLYKAYMIQAGATDPRARKPQFDDELMGQLMRSAVSQQIGSKLGLRYNLHASSTVPVAKLRDKSWVERNGISSSIMDDICCNYVAQPEDHADGNIMFSRIGDYDKWAIEWGYRLLPDSKTSAEENTILNKWIINKLNSGKQYEFGGEDGSSFSTVNDPSNQRNDLGNNAVLAGTYGIKNLKKVMPNLIKWTQRPYENYDRAGEIYLELVNQYERYLQHAAYTIGGLYITPKNSDQPGVVYRFASKQKQQQAMVFLQKELFETPYWLKDNQLYALTYTSYNPVMTVQKNVLSILLDSRCIAKLISFEASDPQKAYTAVQMLSELKKGVFSELPLHKSINVYRRELQKAYVLKLSNMLQSGTGADSEVGSVIRSHAKELMAEFRKAYTGTANKVSKAHLDDMKERLYLALYNPAALPAPPSQIKKAI